MRRAARRSACVCSTRAGTRASSASWRGESKDRLHRPVIAFARAEDGSLRGSARSVSGIHIRDVLDGIATRHPGLIEKFGGHAMAAGMSLPEANLERFRAAFAAEVAARALGDELKGIIHSDGELRPMRCASRPRARSDRPGRGDRDFPEPIFDGGFVIADARIVGGRHLKLLVRGAPAPRGPGGGRRGALIGCLLRCHCIRLRRCGRQFSRASEHAHGRGGRARVPPRDQRVQRHGERAAELPARGFTLSDKMKGYGNQSTQAIHQRSRGAHAVLEEVSLITTTRTSASRKSRASSSSPGSGTMRSARRSSARNARSSRKSSTISIS